MYCTCDGRRVEREAFKYIIVWTTVRNFQGVECGGVEGKKRKKKTNSWGF